MQQTTLAILWHMHQPYYRDMFTGESVLPWARLHGIHSYYDMLRLYENFPNVAGTINFVPSLVEQLLAYTEEGKSDDFLNHTLVPAADLNPSQKSFLLRYFFMTNPDHKIAPYYGYQKLFTRRGLDIHRIDFQQAIRFFSTQDYLDLQVFYNLVWFGFSARDEIPEIGQLLAKGGHFTEEDKHFVIDAQKQILKKLLESLRRAATSANVEISTTPYYHPIFPLLLDTQFAKREMPKAPLPSPVKLPWVAKAELEKAMNSMERWIGMRPEGMWPAEGSVCPEMIPILSDAGIKWMATDNRILFKSLPEMSKNMGLYQPFKATFDNKSINMVFRDHGLSDLIGFTYSKMSATTAVSDFLGHLKNINAHAPKESHLVTIILDGENPWEFYPNSGKDFLTGLFQEVEKSGIRTSKIGSYIKENAPKITINNLHTGSWIDGNFGIWIGKPQKNLGWDYIKKVSDETVGLLSGTNRERDESVKKSFESLCAACGSDWFWWFDDDFDSALKPDFDRLFRQHLKNVFKFLGKDIPIYLFEPIYQFKDIKSELAEPVGFIYPTIDGKRTSFFEWSNAVRINVRGRGGAMAQSAEPFETISFGFNSKAFFLRIDPVDAEKGFSLRDDEALIFHLYDGNKHNKFSIEKNNDSYRLVALETSTDKAFETPHILWAAKNFLEMSIPFVELGYRPNEKMTIAITINRHGVESRRYSHIRFIVPDETYEQKMWAV